MWRLYRVKESNGFVSKRILNQCLYLMSLVYGFSVEKDGRVITNFFEAGDIFRENHAMFL